MALIHKTDHNPGRFDELEARAARAGFLLSEYPDFYALYAEDWRAGLVQNLVDMDAVERQLDAWIAKGPKLPPAYTIERNRR